MLLEDHELLVRLSDGRKRTPEWCLEANYLEITCVIYQVCLLMQKAVHHVLLETSENSMNYLETLWSENINLVRDAVKSLASSSVTAGNPWKLGKDVLSSGVVPLGQWASDSGQPCLPLTWAPCTQLCPAFVYRLCGPSQVDQSSVFGQWTQHFVASHRREKHIHCQLTQLRS